MKGKLILNGISLDQLWKMAQIRDCNAFARIVQEISDDNSEGSIEDCYKKWSEATHYCGDEQSWAIEFVKYYNDQCS